MRMTYKRNETKSVIKIDDFVVLSRETETTNLYSNMSFYASTPDVHASSSPPADAEIKELEICFKPGIFTFFIPQLSSLRRNKSILNILIIYLR